MDGISIAWIITTVVLPLITGATGWLTGRRKSDAEARKVEAEAKMVEAETRKLEITNENSVIDQYKLALADNRAALADNQAHMAEMRLMNQDLIANLEPMRKRISHLETAVRKLKEENKRLKESK